jgi:hypothetical protein
MCPCARQDRALFISSKVVSGSLALQHVDKSTQVVLTNESRGASLKCCISQVSLIVICDYDNPGIRISRF